MQHARPTTIVAPTSSRSATPNSSRTPAMTIWRSVLQGDDACRAREVVEAIVAELELRNLDDSPSLGDGLAGVAVLHGYRALDGAPSAETTAFTCLEKALANAVAAPRPSLFRGYAGLGFAM